MTQSRAAIRDVLIAQKRANEAFDELGKALFRFNESIEQERRKLWSEATVNLEDCSRRPKGQVQELVEEIFVMQMSHPLKFGEIAKIIEKRIGQRPSDSTIRQTLSRMVKDEKLEVYERRYSRGRRLR